MQLPPPPPVPGAPSVANPPSGANPPGGGAPVRIRPSWRAYLRGQGRMLPLLLVLMVLLAVQAATGDDATRSGMLWGGVVGAAVGLIGVVVWFAWVRLDLHDDHLEYRGFRGTQRRGLREVGGCLYMDALKGSAIMPSFTHCGIVDRSGARVVSLSGQMFETAHLHTLADWASRVVAVQRIAEPMTPYRAAKRYPGAFPYATRHPWVMGVVLLVVVLVIVVVAVALGSSGS